MKLLKQTLTWWNGQTVATRFWTWRRGTLVGHDDIGNAYYEDGRRRWVIYLGESDASKVAPEWHGWLHHIWDEPPTVRPVPNKPWEKAHKPNLTGTPTAYAPAGSLRRVEPESRKDYEAWTPE